MPEVRLILWTRSPESGAAVRSPAILKNTGLTSLTINIHVNLSNIMCGLSAFSGEVYSLLRYVELFG